MAHDLAGKVFLITGATEGIGKAAAATVTLIPEEFHGAC